MLMPKRVKYRKRHKGKMRGTAYRGGTLNFGTFGLQALECGRITNRQIEALRQHFFSWHDEKKPVFPTAKLYFGRLKWRPIQPAEPL